MEDKTKAPKRLNFPKEIPALMYGFGDVAFPMQESVEVMESILMDFLQDVCTKSCEFSSKENRKLRLDDFKRTLMNDTKKLARMEELLFMSEDIRKAKQLFEPEAVVDEEKQD